MLHDTCTSFLIYWEIIEREKYGPLCLCCCFLDEVINYTNNWISFDYNKFKYL